MASCYARIWIQPGWDVHLFSISNSMITLTLLYFTMLCCCTISLVTHALNFCPRADQVIFIDGGRIAACGTYEELMAADTEAEESFVARFRPLGDVPRQIIYGPHDVWSGETSWPHYFHN